MSGNKLHILRVALLGATILAGAAPAFADDGPADNTGQAPLPTGQLITPTFATGASLQTLNPNLSDLPGYQATNAVKTALSPDGSTLLVMTSGYNLATGTAGPDDSEYIFVYDVTGSNRAAPVKMQVIKVPNTYVGLVWAPSATTFYASGGASDGVFVFSGSLAGGFAQTAMIPFHHTNYGQVLAALTRNPQFAAFASTGLGLATSSTTAGLGLSADGSTLVAANIANDSITVIDTATNSVRYEYDLRPFNTSGAAGAGVAGGEVPFTVAVTGSAASGVMTAYVSSIRDREIDVIDLIRKQLVTRIALPGNPNSMTLSADQSRLYATQDNSDDVAVIDTRANAVVEEISTIAPPGVLPGGDRAFTGANANSVAIAPNGGTLYVTNGAANSVAVIPISGPAPHAVSALIPTGWYPNSVSVSSDGDQLYIADGKSDPGGDPMETVGAANQYILQLEAANLLTVPVPAPTDYAHLTAQVAANDGYAVAPNPSDATIMAALHARIKHIIYIVRENRTFDQVLGDMTNGANADAGLVMFGRNITPSIHRVASSFVTLDNFFDTGEVSGNGWNWSTGARETDHSVKSIPANYANRAFSNDSEGTVRNIDVGLAALAERELDEPLYGTVASVFPGGAANLLPGTADDFAMDGPPGVPEQSGYIWDAANRAGLTVRNYGFFIDVARYTLDGSPLGVSLAQMPSATGTVVAYPTSPDLPASTDQTKSMTTDPYFRGFDNVYPDVWREQEWQREFTSYVMNNNLPNLTLLRLMHDHQGDFGTALGGLNTPETQVADNDVAVGRVIDAVAHSPYASNTLIFVIEDDAQDGDDHMDAHRSVAFVAGPYVKQRAVVSTRYSTVNMIRTIEDILGMSHLNLNDAYKPPMTNVFDLSRSSWTYTAVASSVLRGTVAANVTGIRFAAGDPRSTHDAAYWADATKGFDFSAEDRVPADEFNRVLWHGLEGGRPYPEVRSGRIMRASAAGN